MGHAPSQQLRCGSLARESTFFLPMHVLASNRNPRSFRGFERRRQIQKWGAHHDLIAAMSSDHWQKVAEEVASLVRGLVHLPVGSHYFFSHLETFSIRNGEAEFVR